MSEDQPIREHSFHVSVARFLFLHPEHGVVPVTDPIKLADAEKYGLSPLLLYCVAVARLPIRWLTFSNFTKPKAFREVLQEAWAVAEGLRGRPEVLRVNRHLASNCPDLVADLDRVGIRLALTDAADKAHPAALRSAQNTALWLRSRGKADGAGCDPIRDICQAASNDHRHDVRHGAHASAPRDMRERVDNWLALPSQNVGKLPDRGLDWSSGSWLSAWQSSLPPDQPRYFHHDDFDGRMWLLTGKENVERMLDDDNFESDDRFEAISELARHLVECWPSPPAEIAASIGITLKQLQWFVAGKADIDSSARRHLEALLGIGFDDRSGNFTAFGPYVLVARKPQALEAIYNEISGGGDANPWELVPDAGTADPSWRYILINTFGSPPSIVMVPRGDRIADRLDNLILNFSGSLPVARSFYREVVSTCARACLTPDANVSSMTEFAKRHEQHWIDCAWQPE